ncbi:MAG: L,D-transpeptidase family protein [Sporichthyaceae bacterium]|nr:L,D-transpeptidase family protein [Sporichthyaceae bacterium]
MPARRLALAATAAAALSLLLTGCNGYGISSGGAAAPAAGRQPTVPVAATPTPTPEPTPTPTQTPTATPTPAPKPKPKALLRLGDRSTKVRELQVRLARQDVFSHAVTGYFGPVTKRAVLDFQAERDLDKLGYVDRKTWSELVERTGTVTNDDMFPKPAGPSDATLHESCLTGRAVCVDKTTRTLRWVVDGEVQYWMAARFGAQSTPTDEGIFSIAWKDRDHISSIYESSMPFSMFFSGGQAIHYSADFASVGYDGASHGCVNVRVWSLVERLFDDTKVGDQVVVYWS